ncbi:hypothetical protein FBQ62_04895 [Salmonella enterica]|nr:hypothetical protein [Salmonella enterica subsp. arizonae serovar 63:z36:-]
MLKNGPEKSAPQTLLGTHFSIYYQSANNCWFYDYAYNMMPVCINMNIMLCPFGLILFDGFNVNLLLIFCVVMLSLMMGFLNLCRVKITKFLSHVLLGCLLLRKIVCVKPLIC